MKHSQALANGTTVHGYIIEDVLGAGGFGITYRARDENLDTIVALKEYFPQQLAYRKGDQTVATRSEANSEELYTWGRSKFQYEADSLAKLHHHNIVGVNYLFEENATAYMVLDYIKGGSMKDWLRSLDRAPTQDELLSVLMPLLNALEQIHSVELLHRDIAPKNIMLPSVDEPILIDFGAVRLFVAQHSQTVANMLTPGYAPGEQYSNKGQGPWTDIYALSATIYEAATGQLPPAGLDRLLEDRYVPVRELARGNYDPRFLELIDWGLRPRMQDRPQSVQEWRAEIHATLAGHGRNGRTSNSDRLAGPMAWFGRFFRN